MKYSHLFLKNPQGTKNYINTNRYNPKNDNNEDEEEEVEVKNYTPLKDRLRSNMRTFNHSREYRKEHRTIDLPYHLEYIEIHFFVQFKKDLGNAKNYYQNKFGLIPVRFTDFNKTVLFYINDEKLFSVFISLVEQFFNAPADEDPTDKDYHIVTSISSFEFLSSEKIKKSVGDKVVISLIDPIEGSEEWYKIGESLSIYFREKSITFNEVTRGILEIDNAEQYVDEMINNFDIIQKVQSLPPVRVTPGAFGTTRFGWDFETSPNDELPIVGVIDTGIDDIDPLVPLIKGETSILDVPMGIGCDHGTHVASLIAFGRDILKLTSPRKAYANLYSIQLLYREEGSFSFVKLRDEIINAHQRYGIRIFNLSVCGLSLEYNVPISEYAIMLDELAYTYDILLFIATGNLDAGYYEFMAQEDNTGLNLVNYPNHFYNHIQRDYSQPTNLGSPAESMNNLTVGAIASNNRNHIVDLTNHHTLPAYYTRKFHVDYAEKINGSGFSKNQKNKNIFKPDILMPGGDWHNEDAKMIVLGRGQTPSDYYVYLSGTSLATPLAANVAAKIVAQYPGISMQSVKALMINSSETTRIDSLLSGMIMKCKEHESRTNYRCVFNDLERGDMMRISGMYNHERLAKYIEGYGVPDEQKCLNSSEKSVTFIIEDSIKIKHYKVQHIKLPDYLLKASRNNVLKIKATLCFKFSPIKNDQIAYNPVHVSFNFVKAQEDFQTTTDILANEKQADGRLLIDSITRRQRLAIKADMGSWSEDFGYVNRQIFSNTQQMELNINKKELRRVKNELAVAIRCLGKENYVDERVDIPFSLVINIQEKESLNLDGHDLYQEISAINRVETIVEIENDIEVDINHQFSLF